jgi:hypothetical protein
MHECINTCLHIALYALMIVEIDIIMQKQVRRNVIRWYTSLIDINAMQFDFNNNNKRKKKKLLYHLTMAKKIMKEKEHFFH